jgi:hypothetical protein
MTTNILTGSKYIADALKRYMVYVMSCKESECRMLFFGESSGLSAEDFMADLWLIEAWHPFEPDNPEGFRTAYKLAGKARCLLLFLQMPEGFHEEGPFWCNPVSTRLSDKINEVLQNPPPSRADFDHLISLWPALAQEPKKQHHSHHHNIKR